MSQAPSSLLSLLSLLLLLLSAAGGADGSCCAPAQWEGSIYYKFTQNSQSHTAYSSIAFDATNQVSSVNLTYEGELRSLSQRLLQDGRKMKMYVVNATTGKCQVLPGARVERLCIPQNFRQLTSFYFGASTEKLDVRLFAGQQAGANVTVGVSSRLCLPIFQTMDTRSQSSTQSFMNFTLGIRSRSVFNVPPQCRSEQHPRFRFVGGRASMTKSYFTLL